MTPRLTLILLALSACAPKTSAPVDFRTSAPTPLERSEFKLPTAQEAVLSNGLKVRYIQDATVPMTRVSVAFRLGSHMDESETAGLATATFDMLNEGVEGYDALAISGEMKRLGAGLSSSAGVDGSSVSVNTLTRNLDESLGFLTKALMQPTFPATEWDRIQKTYLQNLQQARTSPRSISVRVFTNAFYAGDYAGRLRLETHIQTLNVEMMRAWWSEHAVVENAIVGAYGDLPFEEILPKLEAALGGLASGSEIVAPEPKAVELEQTEIRFVHKPGAAQSVIRMGRDLGVSYGDDAYWPARVANAAFGGMFMARLNMNLREDKGYTYGASSWTAPNYGNERWQLATSVRTDATAASLFEIFKELADVGGDAPVRPLTAEEIAYAQGSSVQGYPAQFETAGTLLSKLSDVWIYGLPADAVEAYISNVESVEADAAQAAFADSVANKPLLVVVVGDWDVVGESVTALGYPVVQVDVDGNAIAASSEE